MIIEKVLIFILFLVPLVFFHELGHFFFAKLFGVRVEVFSIGFGKKLLKFKRGDTEYAVSMIPLGGYVKMFGDDPLGKDKIPEKDRPFSYTHKSKWQRFWIVFGGPFANFVLSAVIFFFVFVSDKEVPESLIGAIKKDSVLYQAGVRVGDRIKKVNGEEVLEFADLAVKIEDGISTLTVSRQGVMKKISLNLTGEEFIKEIFQAPPALRVPVLLNELGEYFIISTTSKVDLNTSLDEIFLRRSKNNEYHLFQVKLKEGEKFDLDKIDISKLERKSVVFEASNDNELMEKMREENLFPLEMMIEKIKKDSPAEKSLIQEGDIVASLNGLPVYGFFELKDSLQKTQGPVSVTFFRKGESKTLKLTPEEIDTGDGEKVKLMGIYPSSQYVKAKLVTIPAKGIFESVPLAIKQTWNVIGVTVKGFVKLLTSTNSLKKVGGPLTIGKVASDSFDRSLSSFFHLMALFSINLGVINLLPIPVLDGGHIMFIILEVVNRGPISLRKLEIAQQFGLLVLLTLMLGALFNDFSGLF